MLSASTIHRLSLPSPASVPAAMSDASPRAGRPNPMVVTHTNMMMYSARLMFTRPVGLQI